MQPLVALFFNNFLMKKTGNFCDLFPSSVTPDGVPPSPKGEGICGPMWSSAPTSATYRRFCHCEAHRAVAPERIARGSALGVQSPGTIMRLHEYRWRGDILPGDSHGRHSRPRNDIFFTRLRRFEHIPPLRFREGQDPPLQGNRTYGNA